MAKKNNSPGQLAAIENYKKHRAKPFTKETAKEMGRKGGINSGKIRQRKKKIRECLEIILDLEPGDRNKERLAEAGVDDEDMSNQMLLAMAMFQKAVKGDVRAAEYIRDLTGQHATTPLEEARTRLIDAQTEAYKNNAIDQAQTLERIDELLRGVKASIDEE